MRTTHGSTIMNTNSSIDDGQGRQTELVMTTDTKNEMISPPQQPRRNSFLAGSHSRVSRRNSRTSRRNDRPVLGSPMLEAAECLKCSSMELSNIEIPTLEDDSDSFTCLVKDLSDSDNSDDEDDLDNSISVQMLMSETNTDTDTDTDTVNNTEEGNNNNNNNISNNKINENECGVQQTAKTKSEKTKEFMQRRLNRINPKFFEKNPSKRVPKFDRNELSLGSQLGEGEFGSVFSVESFARRDSKSFIILYEDRESGNSVDTTPGEPRKNSGNLDDFINRWHELLGDAETDRTTSAIATTSTEPTESKPDSCESSTADTQCPGTSPKHERSSEFMRISSQLKENKDYMIHCQNSLEGFDGYAVKLLRSDITNERLKSMAAIDMITEAKILSALSHPNIMQIRGVMGCVELGNYGIIMDKLSSTLQDQIHRWAKYTTEDNVPNKVPGKHRVLEHVPKWMIVRQHEKDKLQTTLRQTEFFVDRMEAVLDVSNAMGYLHEKRIIFRDLKPENVGLANDSYVLFDFGLARELKESDRVGFGDDTYRATGLTGSRLFMSPEVAMKKPYGFSADVYSFAIMFWEVVSLQEVFPNLTMSKHYNQVIVKGKRPPSMTEVLPPELNDMMEASWDKNPTNRPSFQSISKTLVHEIDKIANKKFKSSSESIKSFMSFSNNSASSVASKEFGLNARWDDISSPSSSGGGTQKLVKKMGKKMLPQMPEKTAKRESKMNLTKSWDSLLNLNIKDKKSTKRESKLNSRWDSLGISSNHEKSRRKKGTASSGSPGKIRTSISHTAIFRWERQGHNTGGKKI